MAISKKLESASIDELYLDPFNPRLRRDFRAKAKAQDEILKKMKEWTLEELALSYLESGGFWPHEALLVVKDELYGETKFVVVEGNRRLAALKYLQDAFDGKPVSRKWETIIKDEKQPTDLFSKIPYILADSRDDVQAFLGFRHVTGIKSWGGDEKAGFIAKLIDEQKMTYEQVMCIIGNSTPAVRRHYIAYRVLLQMEESVEEFDHELAEGRFAILYMSLQTEGAKEYLQINMEAGPESAKKPVPKSHLTNLSKFSRWLFGTEDDLPFVTDTRQVSGFGKILENQEAVEYMERTFSPKFDIARRIAGGDKEEIVSLLLQAAYNVQLSLTMIHHFKTVEEVRKKVKLLGTDVIQLLSIFPDIKNELIKERYNA